MMVETTTFDGKSQQTVDKRRREKEECENLGDRGSTRANLKIKAS